MDTGYLTTASGQETKIEKTALMGGEAFVYLPNRRAWNDSLHQLRMIGTLEDNWDGAGALKVQQSLFDTAWLLVKRLMSSNETPPPTSIVPAPMGSIIIEWHSDRGYIEAEVERAHRVSWMFRLNGRDAEFDEMTLLPEESDLKKRPAISASNMTYRTHQEVGGAVAALGVV